MEPYEKNIWTGLGICALGAVVTFITYEAAAPGGTFILAWGAIAAGALQFLIGIGQYFSSTAQTPQRSSSTTDTNEQARVVAQTIAQCMVYVAATDRVLHAEEVSVINKVMHTVFGFGIDDGDIRKIADQETPFVETNYLAERRHLLTTEAKTMIAKACLLVASADGTISDMERLRIKRALDAIGADSGTLEAAENALRTVPEEGRLSADPA